jgi:hypothetical protein
MNLNYEINLLKYRISLIKENIHSCCDIINEAQIDLNNNIDILSKEQSKLKSLINERTNNKIKEYAGNNIFKYTFNNITTINKAKICPVCLRKTNTKHLCCSKQHLKLYNKHPTFQGNCNCIINKDSKVINCNNCGYTCANINCHTFQHNEIPFMNITSDNTSYCYKCVYYMCPITTCCLSDSRPSCKNFYDYDNFNCFICLRKINVLICKTGIEMILNIKPNTDMKKWDKCWKSALGYLCINCSKYNKGTEYPNRTLIKWKKNNILYTSKYDIDDEKTIQQTKLKFHNKLKHILIHNINNIIVNYLL